MDFPILINWASPLSFLGASIRRDFSFSFHLLIKCMKASRISPDGMLHFAASHLGLFYLPMSHKKDARLIWVKCCCCFEPENKYSLH